MAEPTCTVVREGISGNMYPQGPTFHWRDGWYFCRGECMTVQIWNYQRRVELEIPANEWDSIVGHLSHKSS
jgi:hypothetical protein